uniref:MoaB/Mog domain-containing protein n=1 Tax=Setaria digitata TaxID=48799 RepID=A0A915PWW2_9BILA
MTRHEEIVHILQNAENIPHFYHFSFTVSDSSSNGTREDISGSATLSVIEKRCGGLETALHMRSLQATPFAALSRLHAGIRGSTLIVNLPGSPKAVKECFEVLEKILPHAVELLNCKKEQAICEVFARSFTFNYRKKRISYKYVNGSSTKDE